MKFIDFKRVINYKNGVIVIRRLWEDDYEDYYNQLEVTITVGSKAFKLVKYDYRKGFIVEMNKEYAQSQGQKKKMLNELRRSLGMTKKEFSAFMGWLGSFW